jgi:acyl carrier protein
MYGPTETTIWSTVHEVDGGAQVGTVPIGRPIANTYVYVVDEQLELLPEGALGELLIGGEGVARGYLGRADLTAERFISDPFCSARETRVYRTGDLVRWRSDGTLQFVGRKDNQIKLRGHRVELGEIEATLGSHPAIERCAVVARDDSSGDSRLIAYIIPKGSDPIDIAMLRDFLRSELPDIMIPAMFEELSEFPTTPNGKLDVYALPPPGTRRADTCQRFVFATTPIEKALVSIWGEVLGTQCLGIYDSFLEMGGDSLTAIELALRIQDAFGVEVPLHQFFTAPTVAKMAAILEAARADRSTESQT